MAAVHVLYSLSKMGKGKRGDGVKGGREEENRRRRRKKEVHPPVGSCGWTVFAKRLISHAWRIQTIL